MCSHSACEITPLTVRLQAVPRCFPRINPHPSHGLLCATALRQSYDKCMAGDVRKGIQGLDTLRRQFGVDMTGVYGAVIEHIRTQDGFHIAIDTIAGGVAGLYK